MNMDVLRSYLREYLFERLELKSYTSYCELVSQAYDEAPDYDPEAVSSYNALMQHIEKMYKQIQSRIKVEFVSGQPYSTAKEMKDDLEETGILKISTEHNSHSVFSPEQNLKFRAVHDYIVHVLTGRDFSERGEVGAYNAHAKMVPPAAIPALFTEVLAQACYANARGTFPKQKIAILKGFDFYNVGKVEGWDIKDKTMVKK